MIIPKKTIYLLLLFPGNEEPRLFEMPWSERMEKDLRRAMEEAKRRGSPGVVVPFPYRHGLRKGDRMFHPLPRVPNPPKFGEEEPKVYRSPKFEI